MKKVNSVRTSKKLIKTAVKVLKSKHTSKTSKRLAGGVLVNRKKTSKK